MSVGDYDIFFEGWKNHEAVYTVKGWDQWNNVVVEDIYWKGFGDDTDWSKVGLNGLIEDVKQLEDSAVKRLEELAEKDPEAAEKERDRIWRAIQDIAGGG